MKTGDKVQVKVLSKRRVCFRDCLVGKVYPANYLEVDHYGPDGVKAMCDILYFMDDINEWVTFHIDSMKNTFEIVE